MATSAQIERAKAAGFPDSLYSTWDEDDWNAIFPEGQLPPTPLQVETEEVKQEQLAQAENFPPRVAPVMNVEMDKAIQARLDADFEDEDISLDLGIQQEQIDAYRQRRQELQEYASQGKTVSGQIPVTSMIIDEVEDAVSPKDLGPKEGQVIGSGRFLVPSIIEAIMNTADIDSVPVTGWDKVYKSLKPRRIMTEEDVIAMNDIKQEAIKIALEQFEYENKDPEDKGRLEKRVKLIMGNKIPPVPNAIDGFSEGASEEDIVKLFEAGPDTFTDAALSALEWGTTNRREGAGVVESGMMYGARLAQAPVSAAVGAIEGAVTDASMADAIAENIEGGLGTMGGGIKAGGWLGSLADNVIEATGLVENSTIGESIGRKLGGTVGLAIDFYIPIDLGIVGTAGTMVRQATTAAKLESALGKGAGEIAKTAAKEAGTVGKEAARSGAARVVGGAMLPGKTVYETGKTVKALKNRRGPKKKRKAQEKAAKDADTVVDEGSVIQIPTMPQTVQNIFKQTAIEKAIKGVPAESVVTRIAQNFANDGDNITNAAVVWNFKTDYLKGRQVEKGVLETPEAFFKREYSDSVLSWEEFEKIANNGGFKVTNASDIAGFNREALEAIWIASLDDLLSPASKELILGRGLAGSEELVNDIVNNISKLGDKEETFLAIINKMADEKKLVGSTQEGHWTIAVQRALNQRMSGGGKTVIPNLDATDEAAAIAQAYAGKGVSDLVTELQTTGKLGVQPKVEIGGRLLDASQQEKVIEQLKSSEVNTLLQELKANNKIIVDDNGVPSLVFNEKQFVRLLDDLKSSGGLTPTGKADLDLIAGNKDFNELIKRLQKHVDAGEYDTFVIGVQEWNTMMAGKTEMLAARMPLARTKVQVAQDIKASILPETRIAYNNRVLAPAPVRTNLLGERATDMVKDFNDGLNRRVFEDPIGREITDTIQARLGALTENNSSKLGRYRKEGLTPAQAGAKLIVEDTFGSDATLLLREYTNLILGGNEKVARKVLTRGKRSMDVTPEDTNQLTSVILNTDKGKAQIRAIEEAIEAGDNNTALLLLDEWHKMMSGRSISDVFGLRKDLQKIANQLSKDAKTSQAIDPSTADGVSARLLDMADEIAPFYKYDDAALLVHINALQQMRSNIINDVLGNASAKYPELFPDRKLISSQSDIWFNNVLPRQKVVEVFKQGAPKPAEILEQVEGATFKVGNRTMSIPGLKDTYGIDMNLLDEVIAEATTIFRAQEVPIMWDDAVRQVMNQKFTARRLELAETKTGVEKAALMDATQTDQHIDGLLGAGKYDEPVPEIQKYWEELEETAKSSFKEPRDPSAFAPEGTGAAQDAIIELVGRTKDKLWVADAIDNMFQLRGRRAGGAFEAKLQSSVKRLLDLSPADVARLSDTPIEGAAMSPRQIVTALQADEAATAAALDWMLTSGPLKPSWRPGRAYAESLNPATITQSEANRRASLLNRALEDGRPKAQAQALAEATSTESDITNQLRRLQDRTGIQGAEETLKQIEIAPDRRILPEGTRVPNDIHNLSPKETKAAWEAIQKFMITDRRLGEKLRDGFLVYAGYANNVAKSGMLSGFGVPSLRYAFNNTSTAPSIMYSTIGELGLQGASRVDKGARVVAYANNVWTGTGKPASTEVLAITPAGKVYTTEMLAEIMKTNGLARSQASAELTSNVAGDFMRESNIEFKRFVDGLPQGERSAARAWYERNVTAWKGTNIFGKFANESDNAFRAGVLVASLEKGIPLDEAVKLSRESLFDYSRSIKGLHRWVWFLTFRANNWKTFAKNAIKNPSRLKNQVIAARGVPEEDIQGKYRRHIARQDYTATRIYFGTRADADTKQRVGVYSPPLPQLEAMADVAAIMQAHAEWVLRHKGTIPVGDAGEELRKAYYRAIGQNVNPHVNVIASELFGVDMRKGPDRQVTNIVDGWLVMALQERPELWEAFKDEFNIVPVAKDREYPGGSTFQGRQWVIQKGDEAARKRYNRFKYALMITGQERGLREQVPNAMKLFGVQDARRQAGDVVEMKYDPSWAQSLGIETPIQEPTIEEIERKNRRNKQFEIRP